MTLIDYRGKVLRDPVYGNLAVPYRVLLDLIDRPEFQRLRNIRQLGMCFTTFHGAEHSRFQHALGAMWLMYRVLERWEREQLCKLTPRDIQHACAATLLHDIGHGPFSHGLERVFTHVSHEKLGQRIVLSRLADVFRAHDLDPEAVVGMMAGTYPQPVFHELLASQVDVDRMDYLQRDSLYTGVKYGLFDCDRIVMSLAPLKEKNRLLAALDPKGTEAVEEFLFSRYFMHWQVYFHRTVRSAELLLRVVLERARHAYRRDPGLLEVPRNLDFLFSCEDTDSEEFLDGFLGMDDFDFFNAIKLWQSSRDPVLADLSQRSVQRRLFKALPHPGSGKALEGIKALAQEQFGDEWRYYVREDAPSSEGFGFSRPGRRTTPIRVLSEGGGWREISQVTRTDAIRALGQKVSVGYLMVAHELRDRATALLK